MHSLVHPLPPPRLGALPNSVRAVRRTTRRLSRVGLFSLDVASRVRGRSFEGPRERASEIQWIAENLAALHGLHVDVRGLLPTGPALIVANHITYLDPLAICSQVAAVPLAKDEVRSWPALGELGSRLGVLFVRRGVVMSGAQVLRQSKRLLEAGVSVLVFPEGTTTRGQSVLPMLSGAFGIAARVGVPIVPVALSYDDPRVPWVDQDAFVPHYLRTAVRACTTVRVEFLPALPTRADDTPASLASRARARILHALDTGAGPAPVIATATQRVC